MNSLKTFTQTSDQPYSRHHYKVSKKSGESITFESWEDAQAYWFSACQLKNLSHIDVLDVKSSQSKGFK